MWARAARSRSQASIATADIPQRRPSALSPDVAGSEGTMVGPRTSSLSAASIHCAFRTWIAHARGSWPATPGDEPSACDTCVRSHTQGRKPVPCLRRRLNAWHAAIRIDVTSDRAKGPRNQNGSKDNADGARAPMLSIYSNVLLNTGNYPALHPTRRRALFESSLRTRPPQGKCPAKGLWMLVYRGMRTRRLPN